jgi:hypothetical protein
VHGIHFSAARERSLRTRHPNSCSTTVPHGQTSPQIPNPSYPPLGGKHWTKCADNGFLWLLPAGPARISTRWVPTNHWPLVTDNAGNACIRRTANARVAARCFGCPANAPNFSAQTNVAKPIMRESWPTGSSVVWRNQPKLVWRHSWRGSRKVRVVQVKSILDGWGQILAVARAQRALLTGVHANGSCKRRPD